MTQTTERPPMRIVSLTAENVKRIRAVHIEPTGALVQITGANRSGKSSVLDSIWWALAGKGVIEAVPVRQGEESAKIVIDFGSLIVTRTFDADGTTSLKVESGEGALFPSPQRLLDSFLGSLSFDPLAFMEKDPKGQLAELRRLVRLDVDVDLLDGQNAADFANRTDVNRRVKALEAKVEMYGRGLADGEVEPIDTSAILRQMEEASKKNTALEAEKARREKMGADATYCLDTAKRRRDEAAKLIAQAEELEAKGKALEVERSALPAVSDPADVSALREEVEEASKENARRSLQRTQRANHEAALAEFATAVAEADELTRRMKERTETKTAAIAAAKMPVEGLGFGDGMVLYRGLPLAQASGAETWEVVLAICAAMNPTLRVILIKQGSLLDENAKARVATWAEEKGYQVWMETVDTSGKVGIVMEDGRARLADVAEAET